MLRRLPINEKPSFDSIGYSHQQVSCVPCGTGNLKSKITAKSKAKIKAKKSTATTCKKSTTAATWKNELDELYCGAPTYDLRVAITMEHICIWHMGIVRSLAAS